jgi:deoxyribose-phosphate aldolase
MLGAMWTRAQVAALIDHTLLRPEATPVEIEALCAEAVELGVASVCVSPTYATEAVAFAGAIPVCCVVGFPSGAHDEHVKADEAARASAAGAREIDMVIPLGAARTGNWAAVEEQIALVRGATSGLLKVIIESALLDEAGIVRACQVSRDAGADFVKTSTGFHPAGGASIAAVRRMSATVGDRLGVKASGGIRTAADAIAMLDAGATRLGLSASRAVLAEIKV